MTSGNRSQPGPAGAAPRRPGARLGILALLVAIASPVSAQTTSDAPHVGYVYPGGGCRGTTFEVVVGGENIKQATEAYISGGGITAEIVRWYQPMTEGEYTNLNMEISGKQEELEKSGKPATRQDAIKAAGITEDELKEMAIYEKRRDDPKRQLNPQIVEELTLRIQIAPDAQFGDRELRLLAPANMSNPLWFYVGQWPETREKEPNDLAPEPSVEVKLPMVLNGQVFPGDVDRFAFEATQGTKLVAQCAARELIPYLADAVPGWFQAVLHLYDDQGKEVAFADSLGFRHDPVLYCEIPKNGRYVLEVHDSIYRGREDFTYRISLGEIPYVTGLFPLGGRADEACTVEVKGWNLPVETLRMAPTNDRGRIIRPVVLEKDNIFSNRVGFIVDSLMEVAERESNDTPGTAQGAGGAVAINGRIDRPGDIDFFKIDASGMIVAEVYARRLYSPVDSLVCLTDSAGNMTAYNDDFVDKAWPLITHHADSRLLTSTQGSRYISIRDAQGRGGPDYAYRLYIRPPRPDFDLRVTPASVTARAGSYVPIAVYAIRRDGFDDDIALELENPPQGFALNGAWIPSGQESVRLTLRVPDQASSKPVTLQLIGHSKSRGKPISRLALPTEEVTQAFILKHLVPTKDWTLFVTGNPRGKPPCTFVDAGVQLPSEGTGQLRVMVDPGQEAREFRFELSEPPSGITLETPVVVGGGGLIVPIKVDPAKVKPGQKGNLLFLLSREHTYLSPETRKLTTSNNGIGLLPAIPFEVKSRR